MDIGIYIDKNKDIQNSLLSFLNSSEDESFRFLDLIGILQTQQILENSIELKEFLCFLVKVSKSAHRSTNFFEKIEKILINLEKDVKHFFSNIEIFNIFKSNKMILLIAISQKIIKLDEFITYLIIENNDHTKIKYCLFFYNEIKEFCDNNILKSIEKEINEYNPNILNNFQQIRQLGENESNLCSMIRNDSIEEFCIFVNKTNFPIQSYTIAPSLFETNSFLMKNEPTLIEYAAFYGSIQIFQYLLFNNVELSASLWIYAIHGNSAEIIHILEDNKVETSFEDCLKEAIKCHHNAICDYILNNLIDPKINYSILLNENIVKTILSCYNYSYFPNDFDDNFAFFYLCYYDYKKAVDLHLETKKQNENNLALKEAANNNDINAIYYSLSTINKIESGFFSENQKLIKISIPFSITEIDQNSFKGCSSIKQISLPSSLIKIGNFAFFDCNSLIKIKIPSSVESIGKYAFKNCTSLKQVVFQQPSSITAFERNVFDGCSKLEEITIPSSVKTISSFSIYKCNSLKKLLIPSSVVKIESHAFRENSSLQSVSIPQSINVIDDFVFGYLPITQIEIPSSVTKIEDHAFLGCSLLVDIAIPTSVTSIGKSAFEKCKRLKEIKISNSIISIEEKCFYDCSSLEIIEIPSSVTSIGNHAFSQCESLKEIEIPSSVTSIGNHAFSRCNSFKEIEIPSSVTSIGGSVFYGCNSLEKIELPSSLTKIKSSLAAYCYSLKNINIPSSICKIGLGSFESCTSLEQIELPSSVKQIGKYAFRNCSSLKQINIPSSVWTIGDMAFCGCEYLQHLEIPYTVTLVGKNIFKEPDPCEIQ